jgi:hypothetical protein
MFDTMVGQAGDAGDDIAAAAVESLRVGTVVRASVDAVELQAVATLAQVRRTQAQAEARERGRERDRARGATPGSGPVPRVDIDLVDRCTAQEVSVALWLSPVVARERLELALELVEHRPATMQALRAGTIDLARARRIAEAVRHLPPDPPDGPGSPAPSSSAAADAVEAEVLRPGSVPLLSSPRPGRPAGELTLAQLRQRLQRLVLRADPGGAMERTRLADERRGCTLRALPDGMAVLSVTGRGELLAAVLSRVDAVARSLVAEQQRVAVEQREAVDPSDPPSSRPHGPLPGVDAARTLDQTRVDVVIGSLLGHSDELGRADGVRVDLALVVPAGTVLAGGDEPGELLGYGPLPAPLVRELAADASWRRWTSDPETGQVTATSRRRYRPSPAVADQVRARDLLCRFPTCRRRAQACDLDHVVPFPTGDTGPDTLCSLCRTHHLVVHRSGFGHAMTADGTITWTTPTGGQVVEHPPSWGRPPPVPDDGRRGGGAPGDAGGDAGGDGLCGAPADGAGRPPPV